jgi:hypothetical protein
MANGDPPQVTDAPAPTKVDWKVSLRAGGTAGAIDGSLFWRGSLWALPAGGTSSAVASRFGAAAVAVALFAAVVPAGASAHGLAGRSDLPVPSRLFGACDVNHLLAAASCAPRRGGDTRAGGR